MGAATCFQAVPFHRSITGVPPTGQPSVQPTAQALAAEVAATPARALPYFPAAGTGLATRLQALVYLAVLIDRRCGAIMAEINGAHPRPVQVGIQTPCFKIVVRRLARTTWIGLFQQQIERKKRTGFATVHPQTLARLGPERRRAIHVICVRTRIGGAAEPASVELMHARIAFASFAGLAVHLAANSAALVFCQSAARDIHAHPEAGKSAKKIMNAARQESGTFRVNSRHAAQSHEYRRSRIGLSRCIGK